MSSARRLPLLSLLLLGSASPFVAAAPLCAQEEAPRGWVSFCTVPGELNPLAAPLRPAAAYLLEPGEVLHPRERSVTSSWWHSGEVEIEDAGVYRFGMRKSGPIGPNDRMTVHLPETEEVLFVSPTADGAWTEPITLPRGTVTLDVAAGTQLRSEDRMQILWQREQDRFPGFGPEPIPSRFVTPGHQPFERDEFDGRVLLETKGCTSCHSPGRAEHAVGVRPGPDLARIGARVQPTWLLSWILDPSSFREHADMPDLFGTSDAERVDAEAVVHFLMSRADEPTTDFDPGDARGDGEMLYHTIGCVACHGARLSQAELHGDEYLDASVPGAPMFPLERLEEKWHRRELARFLLNPVEVHRDGRMPSFGLTEVEAQALAFALVPREVLPAFQLDAARAERGAEVFAARGCAACHSLGDEAVASTRPGAKALTSLSAALTPRSCFHGSEAEAGAGGMPIPRYDLDDRERLLLHGAISAAKSAHDAPARLDELDRRVDALGCLRCHAMDGRGGRPDELDLYFVTNEEDTDLGDEGRLPPDLSDVGFKLATPWLDEVLTGDGRARPWIATRMPHYGDATEGMAELFARKLGVAPNSDGGDAGEPEATDELTLAGRALMDRDALSCVACHLYKDYPANGTVGPDVTKFGERLRYEWFAAYMRNPMRYKPGTRMPTFVDQSGKSTATAIFGGDLERQIDALWSYFSLGDAMPPPPGVEPARGMPVLVGERPRVMRTFLEDAGSRGIAVGFPVGIHFAFDAEACRLVSAWRGDFLDVSGAWAGRGGNVSGGRGATLWSAPVGASLAIVDDGEDARNWSELDLSGSEPRFRGYRLDPNGSPVFEYTLGPVEIAERWSPHLTPKPGFVRAFTLRGLPAGARVAVHVGPAGGAGGWAPDLTAKSLNPSGDQSPEETGFYLLDATDPDAAIELEVTL